MPEYGKIRVRENPYSDVFYEVTFINPKFGSKLKNLDCNSINGALDTFLTLISFFKYILKKRKENSKSSTSRA